MLFGAVCKKWDKDAYMKRKRDSSGNVKIDQSMDTKKLFTSDLEKKSVYYSVPWPGYKILRQTFISTTLPLLVSFAIASNVILEVYRKEKEEGGKRPFSYKTMLLMPILRYPRFYCDVGLFQPHPLHQHSQL